MKRIDNDSQSSGCSLVLTDGASCVNIGIVLLIMPVLWFVFILLNYFYFSSLIMAGLFRVVKHQPVKCSVKMYKTFKFIFGFIV